MALIKQYEDASGNLYEASYWRACHISIDSAAFIIAVTFLAWRDAEAFQSKKSPLPGVAKGYLITGADFLAVASAAPTGATLYDVLANATEAYALGKPDFEGATQA